MKDIILWVKNKKKIEEEIEEQDKQYEKILRKNGELESKIEKLKEQLKIVENDRQEKISKIGELRKKYNLSKKELKDVIDKIKKEQDIKQNCLKYYYQELSKKEKNNKYMPDEAVHIFNLLNENIKLKGDE